MSMKNLKTSVFTIFSAIALFILSTSAITRNSATGTFLPEADSICGADAGMAASAAVTDDTVSNFEALVSELTEFASTHLGKRYVWGATGPKSFDCSGFTSYVFRNSGIELPRTSRMQYSEGEKVDRGDMRPGDLMFFSSPRSGRGVVGHVGIVVDVDPESNNVTFIHASTSKGITYQTFPDGGYYSKNYIGAKRVIDDSPAA